MRSVKRGNVALVLVMLITAGEAHADDTCDSAYERGQLLQRQKKLIEARDNFSTCVNICTSASKAEKWAQRDCSELLTKLAIPSVVLVATDSNGARLTEVSVIVDGITEALPVDGKAVDINPGSHSFLFTSHQGFQTTVQQVIDEGKQGQEVHAVLGSASESPITETPSRPSLLQKPGALSPHTPVRPDARRVFFRSETDGNWKLTTSGGALVCSLPCTADLVPEQGYEIRSGTRRMLATFLGADATNSATVLAPTGNKDAAATFFVLSAIIVGAGTVLYFSGNTETCGYGETKDGDDTHYQYEIKGACDSTSPPSGYKTSDGKQLGDTQDRNRKLGLVFGSIGAAGIVSSGIWWLTSRSSYRLEWASAPGDVHRFYLAVTIAPNGLGVDGSW